MSTLVYLSHNHSGVFRRHVRGGGKLGTFGQIQPSQRYRPLAHSMCLPDYRRVGLSMFSLNLTTV